jgi:hypothetical protein
MWGEERPSRILRIWVRREAENKTNSNNPKVYDHVLLHMCPAMRKESRFVKIEKRTRHYK